MAGGKARNEKTEIHILNYIYYDGDIKISCNGIH